MVVIDEPSGHQEERSPLQKGAEINTTTLASSAALGTAPPPYTSIPTPPPNPIPRSQPIPQTNPQSHHVILLHRQSPLRRFLAALAVAWLVVFLWSALVHSFNHVRHFPGHRHGYDYEVVRFAFLPFLNAPELINSERIPLVDSNLERGLTIRVAFYQSNTHPSSFLKWRNRSSLSSSFKSVSISPSFSLSFADAQSEVEVLSIVRKR